jgi:hypothetical protein
MRTPETGMRLQVRNSDGLWVTIRTASVYGEAYGAMELIQILSLGPGNELGPNGPVPTTWTRLADRIADGEAGVVVALLRQK